MERIESPNGRNNTEGKVIELDQLCRGDRVWVQTRRSRYQFSVLDPSIRSGKLTGGVLGDQIIDAFLGGAASEDIINEDSTELKIGTRAVFFLEVNHQAQRLTTSPITDIALIN